MEIKEIITKIQAKKDIIAKERDELVELYDNLGYLIEALNTGIEDIDYGATTILDGIESLSTVL